MSWVVDRQRIRIVSHSSFVVVNWQQCSAPLQVSCVSWSLLLEPCVLQKWDEKDEERIVDAEAKKPDDWHDEDDGRWIMRLQPKVRGRLQRHDNREYRVRR